MPGVVAFIAYTGILIFSLSRIIRVSREVFLELRMILRPPEWKRVSGRIVSSSLHADPDDSHASARVEYVYNYLDTEYRGTRIRLGSYHQGRRKALRLHNSLPEYLPLEVFVNAGKPEVAFLNIAGNPAEGLFILTCLAGFAGMLIYVEFFLIRTLITLPIFL